MSADRKMKLLALRAQIDDLIAEEGAEKASRSDAAEPLYLDADEFASRHKICADTVRRYCKAGMPHARVGRLFRIRVSEADAWLLAGGAAASAAREGAVHGRKS